MVLCEWRHTHGHTYMYNRSHYFLQKSHTQRRKTNSNPLSRLMVLSYQTMIL